LIKSVVEKYLGINVAMKKEEKSGRAAIYIGLIAITFLQFIVFGMVTIVYHYILKKKYFQQDGVQDSIARRINDIRAMRKPFMMIVFGPSLIALICLYPFWQAEPALSQSAARSVLLLESPLLVAWIWLSFISFKWLAVAHFGVIVDPEKDRVVFRYDQESYDFIDYLKLRFIRDLPRMDEVRLSEIGRITRKLGEDLYIHGSFGSRRITFTNKQKRDECIYAIQSSGKTTAKVPVEFEKT
jgi:hypothetical protein